VIRISSPWVFAYGHVLLDVIGPLFCFPIDIINSSRFFCADFPRGFLLDCLRWFNLEKEMIVIQLGQYILAQQIYTYDRGFGSNYAPEGFARMKSWIQKRNRFESRPAWRCGFFNRDKFKMRWMSNMDHIMKMAKAKYQGFAWQPVGAKKSIEETAIFFDSLKFIFGMHGSGLLNVIFMQPKSVVCEVQSQSHFVVISELSRIFGLFHIASRLGNILHYSSLVTMPEGLAMLMIDRAVAFMNVYI
jgi:capsular polysaccharide biosynthesis protein